ncbi:hypothetical protein C2S53_010992 [Perilla frutescens var. hirtella]|uniref:Uncharacterized protein n=1 Tax=Perilla frutescens var. hirtella TaxID=608512 RepID=A0AAD4P8X4_PERFH|nr:hypothetical protein C2S53_010992 [Perilla frutescens var. hirtella]
MLMAAAMPLEQMILIDTLERLGLAYHFETEIEHKLREIYNAGEEEDCDLFTTSLRFRLLRQHHHHISCNVFDKFVDKDGKFEETLSRDPEGLLSLYDAAHVRFHDEKILDEAARFTRHELSGMESQLESPLREKVKRALEHPLHREVPIFHARIFISIYEKDESRDERLLKLAKFNFNFLQNLYKNELCELTRWWNKFDLKSKLPYARDRLVEAYIWGIGFYFEPQYSYVRLALAKGTQIIGIMDDTYDNYATLNEADLLTKILHRWNIEETDGVPDYMKTVCQFIMSTTEDFEHNAAKQGKEFAAPYFKETVQQIARAYNQELKWVMERQMPSFQEYAKNSEVTSCIYIIFAGIILGLKSATKGTIGWIKSEPKIAISTGMIGRYWDDIGSHERENKGGKMLTAVDCYMKQYGISKEETISKFAELIEEAWKDVIEETMTSKLPKETTMQFINYARLCDATYNKNNGDGYSDPKIFAVLVAALFVDPIVI